MIPVLWTLKLKVITSRSESEKGAPLDGWNFYCYGLHTGCRQPLYPGKLTWNPKSWRFGRWFSFPKKVILCSMLTFRGENFLFAFMIQPDLSQNPNDFQILSEKTGGKNCQTNHHKTWEPFSKSCAIDSKRFHHLEVQPFPKKGVGNLLWPCILVEGSDFKECFLQTNSLKTSWDSFSLLEVCSI